MPQRALYSNFVGGINNNTPPDHIEDHEVVDALNVIFDKKDHLVTRRGLTRIDEGGNFISHSNNFANAWWSKVSTSVTTGPPDKITTTSTASLAGLLISFPIPIYKPGVGGIKYTASIEVKKSDYLNHRFCYLQVGGGSNKVIYLDVDTGECRIQGATPLIPVEGGAEDSGDFWRLYITYISAASDPDISVVFRCTTGGTELSNLTTSGATVIGEYKYIQKAQLEIGELSNYHENTTTPLTISDLLTGNVTAIYDYQKTTDDTRAFIIASGGKLLRLNETLGYFQNISPGLTLPTNAYWQFAMYDDWLVGTNGGGGANVNPIIIKNTNVNAAALGGSPPNKAKYCLMWNNRMWLAHGNSLTCSALGNIENYTATGKAGSQTYEIGGHEGDEITGLTAFKNRLIVFKTSKIYVIIPGSPNVDISQYEAIMLADGIGCISSWSIQHIIDDVVFLSKHGIASLTAVEQYGEFAETIVSQKIRDLNDFRMEETNSASAVDITESQYLLAAPLQGGTVHTDLWVMDYSKIANKTVGFTRFKGKIVGASMANVEYQGQSRVYIGGYANPENYHIAHVYRYGDTNVYTDDGSFYDVKVVSKAYDLGERFNSKIFHRIYFTFYLITDVVNLALSYIYDQSDIKIKTFQKQFSGDVFVGGAWDIGKWDEMNWASQDSLARQIKKKIIGRPGRLAKSIQFIINNVVKGQAFVLTSLGFDYDPASIHKD